LKVVVGGGNEMLVDRHNNNNLSMISGSISKRDNIWIHIQSRPEESANIDDDNKDKDKVLETADANFASKHVSKSNESHTIKSNSSEIRLVRKTESVSEKKSESSTVDETTKRTFEDYKVAGWPPEVSRNVSHYVDLLNNDSPMLKPKLGPILPKNKLGKNYLHSKTISNCCDSPVIIRTDDRHLTVLA
jgi:hypothetical protein